MSVQNKVSIQTLQTGVPGLDEIQCDLEERRGHPGADGEAQRPRRERLQQNHANELCVGDAHGLQGTELFQVLDREQVERLPGDDCAHDKRHGDCDAKVHRNASVAQVVIDTVPRELLCRTGTKSRALLNSRRQLVRRHPGRRSRDHERKLGALAPQEVDRFAVPGMHDRQARERRRRVRDADNRDAVVVHLERAVEREGLVGKEQDVSGLVDDH